MELRRGHTESLQCSELGKDAVLRELQCCALMLPRPMLEHRVGQAAHGEAPCLTHLLVSALWCFHFPAFFFPLYLSNFYSQNCYLLVLFFLLLFFFFFLLALNISNFIVSLEIAIYFPMLLLSAFISLLQGH